MRTRPPHVGIVVQAGLLVVSCGALGVGALGAACGSPADVMPCGQIPADGCPIGRGGSCEDALCAALYDCVEGAWVEVVVCDDFAPDAGVEDGGFGSDGGCASFEFDHTGEASGCEPELQEPDCPAEAAEQCAASACLTGCVDFFICEPRGWVDVGYCDEDGMLVVTQP